MATVCSMEFNTRQFVWSKQHRQFFSEASTLGMRPGQLFSRIYDDATDEGFYLVSHKTGAKVLMHMVDCREELNSRGDEETVAWVFKPVHRNHSNHNFEVLILND